MEIAKYPDSVEVCMDFRSYLHPKFQGLTDGISEYTFANIFLFRHQHFYHLSMLSNELLLISGKDDNEQFFMLPFGLPDDQILRELFKRFAIMKAVPETYAIELNKKGYTILLDRDNFDYLYSRQDLANLNGRKFHKKKNLVNTFLRNNHCQSKPLLEEYKDDAVQVLETWKEQHKNEADYLSAKEALEKMWQLQLCGGIFYINEKPVAYCLGEEIANGKSFVLHFEKSEVNDKYKGIYQYINQSFVSLLPEKYETVNREQDLGISGLRHAKESYNPIGFVKKYKVFK